MKSVALFGVVCVLISSVLTSRSPVASAIREGRPLTGILLGTDWVDYSQHSDTLMLWHYNPLKRKLDILSIPRDTKISLPGYRFNRINEVFAYHYGVTKNQKKAAAEVVSAVKHIIGKELDPSFYLHVNYDGFRRFIDLLGGIRLKISEPMHYDDEAGHFHFHKDPGVYVLNGHDSLGFVRFRGKSGDRGRILRQMEFMKALAEKVISPLLYVQWPRLILTILDSFESNLGLWDTLSGAMEAKYFDKDRVNPWLLPGKPRRAYWEMDHERLSLVVKQILGENVTLPTTATKVQKSVITVKVWNATPSAGLALRASRQLRSAHFDVLDYGNYKARQTVTRVIDRTGRIEKAKKVAKALGVSSVFSDVNPKRKTDVEVILGDDFQPQK